MPNTAYVTFTAEINSSTTERLQGFVADKLSQGADSVYILLSSLGGGVKDGITLYNFLKSLPAEIIMHNIGRVNSIANVVFAAGKQRYAVEHSSFMFHGVGFNITQATRFEEKDLREKLDSVLGDQKNIADILQAEMNLPTDKTEQMFLRAATIPASEAKSLGLVHDIRNVVIPKGTQLHQLVTQ